MKKKLTGLALFSGCALLLIPAAMADPACSTGALNGGSPVYTSGYACTVTDAVTGVTLEFSNFTFSQTPNQNLPTVNANPVPPDPGGVPGIGNDVGLNFTGGWNATNTEDVNIGFTVTDKTGGNLIDDVFVFFSNVGTPTGTEVLNYNEQFCGNGKCDSISIQNPGTDTTADVLLSNTKVGGPVTSLTISKDVQFSGTGTLYLSGFGNAYSYSTVPEPRGISLLLAAGLLAGALVFKRRTAAQN